MFVMPGDRAGRLRVVPFSLYSFPLLSSFTFQNQGTSTAIQTVAGGPIVVNFQNNAAVNNWRILTAAQPTIPYKVKMQLQPYFSLGNSQTLGVYFYDGTRIAGIDMLGQTAGTQVRVNRVSALVGGSQSATGFPTPFGGQWTANPPATSPTWFQLRNDGVNLNYDISLDGVNFVNGVTDTVGGANITPTQIGFGGLNVISSGGTGLYCWFLNWIISPNANLNG